MIAWKELLQYLQVDGIEFNELSETQIALGSEPAFKSGELVIASLLEVDGVEWCEFTVALSGKSHAEAKLLAKNATALPGALCVRDNEYLLRYAFALAHSSGPSFRFYLRKLAAEATNLQHEMDSEAG